MNKAASQNAKGSTGAWMDRRLFLAAAAGTALAAPALATPASTGGAMHGVIGRMRAVTGQREALLSILLEGTAEMPGCLLYVIARDPADADALWITEVWRDPESHAASLSLPQVREAISRARPLIAGFDERHETQPVGGIGLPSRPT